MSPRRADSRLRTRNRNERKPPARLLRKFVSQLFATVNFFLPSVTPICHPRFVPARHNRSRFAFDVIAMRLSRLKTPVFRGYSRSFTRRWVGNTHEECQSCLGGG